MWSMLFAIVKNIPWVILIPKNLVHPRQKSFIVKKNSSKIFKNPVVVMDQVRIFEGVKFRSHFPMFINLDDV